MEKVETLVNRVIELADLQPDKPAVIFKGEILTYRKLLEKSVAMSEQIKRLGINKKDRVSFSAVSRPETVACYLGIQLLGAVPVFLDKVATPKSMVSVYNESESKLLLTDKSMKGYESDCFAKSLRALYNDAQPNTDEHVAFISPYPEDIAELLFTTGTTGRPKGVMLSYRAVYHILRNTIDGVGMLHDDILLLPLPLNHSFALRELRAALYNGETVVLQNGFTFATETEHNINIYHCNALALVPASFGVLRSQMQNHFQKILGTIRYLEFGAGSLTPGQRTEIVSLLPNVDIFNVWGSSETGGALFCDVKKCVRDKKKIAAVGKPLPGIEVVVMDNEGKFLENFDSAHPGRMALKGNMLMSGYWRQPELTKETIKDGWLLTNDLIYKDDDGDVFMLGRADDVISVGGDKVSPLEIEDAVSEYPLVLESVCIGVNDPDRILGEVPILMVKAKPGFDKNELLRFLAMRLERYKLPHEIITIEGVPRNRMQKIDRKAAKRLWENKDTLKLINPVIQTILSRRSIRNFKDEKIPQEVMKILLRAGRQAPSGHNMQTWHFTVVTEPEALKKLRVAARNTADRMKVYFFGWENPVAVVLISNDKRNPYGCQDVSCAAENIMLAATSLGIGSVWLNPLMTLRDEEPVKSVLDGFGVPSNHIVWATIALGYPFAEGVSLVRKDDVVTWI